MKTDEVKIKWGKLNDNKNREVSLSLHYKEVASQNTSHLKNVHVVYLLQNSNYLERIHATCVLSSWIKFGSNT